jgi:hypothetical protein
MHLAPLNPLVPLWATYEGLTNFHSYFASTIKSVKFKCPRMLLSGCWGDLFCLQTGRWQVIQGNSTPLWLLPLLNKLLHPQRNKGGRDMIYDLVELWNQSQQQSYLQTFYEVKILGLWIFKPWNLGIWLSFHF